MIGFELQIVGQLNYYAAIKGILVVIGIDMNH